MNKKKIAKFTNREYHLARVVLSGDILYLPGRRPKRITSHRDQAAPYERIIVASKWLALFFCGILTRSVRDFYLNVASQRTSARFFFRGSGGGGSRQLRPGSEQPPSVFIHNPTTWNDGRWPKPEICVSNWDLNQVSIIGCIDFSRLFLMKRVWRKSWSVFTQIVNQLWSLSLFLRKRRQK